MGVGFYSYLWLREDGTPYYAGKGSGRRAFDNKRHSIKCPQDRSRIVIFPMDNEPDAFESEKALIQLFGRKDLGTGILRNFSDGGEGPAGRIVSEVTRQRKREAALRRPPMSEETRCKISESLTGRAGKPRSQETRMKISNSKKGKPAPWMLGNTLRLGKPHSDELKQKMSIRLRGNKFAQRKAA